MRHNPVLKYLYMAFLVLVGLSILFSLMGSVKRSVDYSFDDSNVEDWGRKWSVRGENLRGIRRDLPVRLDCEPGAKIIISKRLPQNLNGANSIMIESKRQDMSVYIEGELRKEYSDYGQRISRSLPHSYVMVPISADDAGSLVRVETMTDTFYSGNLGSVFIGTEMSLILMLLKNNIIWLGMICGIFIIGLTGLVCFIVYRKIFSGAMGFLSIFWFAMFNVIWCFSQSKIRQIFVTDVPLLESVGHCYFMLIPIPVILMINGVTRARYTKFLMPCMAISLVNFLFQNIMHTTRGWDYFKLQNYTQLFLLFLLIASLICCVSFTKSKTGGNAMYNTMGLIVFIAGILSEAAGVAFVVDYPIGSGYIIGALSFLSLSVMGAYVGVRVEQQRRINAESANRAKSRFLATMSHEIRTPINAVLGMNEMILRESQEPNTREHALDIDEAGKLLLSLVNDILDFSKIESGKMDIVDVEYHVKPLLSDLIMMVKQRLSKKPIKLELDIDEKIPAKLYGDEVRIKQIVTNLLTNAAKYTESGTVTFSVKVDRIENDIAFLHYSVKDTGIGIKPEDLETLKNSAFVRVDKVRNRNIEGTGLGLSITRQLIGLMGSELVIDSEYGKGSDFHFVIKQKIVDAAPMGSIANRNAESERKKTNTFTAPEVKLLAVDDTKVNLKVINGLLSGYKMQIDTAVSGEECLKLCGEKYYDLILMDHMMPGMDGIETLRHLREGHTQCRNVKVIALTANAISGAERMYSECGFDGYLTKPMDLKELDACLKANLPRNKIIYDEE